MGVLMVRAKGAARSSFPGRVLMLLVVLLPAHAHAHAHAAQLLLLPSLLLSLGWALLSMVSLVTAHVTGVLSLGCGQRCWEDLFLVMVLPCMHFTLVPSNPGGHLRLLLLLLLLYCCTSLVIALSIFVRLFAQAPQHCTFLALARCGDQDESNTPHVAHSSASSALSAEESEGQDEQVAKLAGSNSAILHEVAVASKPKGVR